MEKIDKVSIRNDLLFLSQFGYSNRLLNSLYLEKVHYLEAIYNEGSQFFQKNKKYFTKKDFKLRQRYQDLINFKEIFIKKMKEYKEKGIKILFKYDENFPHCIKTSSYNLFLYTWGDLTLLKEKNKVAIVGSRDLNTKATSCTSFLVKDYVDRNFVTVSGLAKGVDTIVHSETLKYNGKTIAIMATSFETIYPVENKELFNDIIRKKSLVITEYGPFQKTYKSYFLQRNSLVAQISNEVVVVKASLKSGTLNTVRKANMLNKKVYYLPELIDYEVESYLRSIGAIKYSK